MVKILKAKLSSWLRHWSDGLIDDTTPFKLEEGHVVTKAFFKDNVQYYQMHDVFNTFCARAMDALSVYESWQMRCTREFLVEHIKAQRKIKGEMRKLFTAKGGELDLNAIFERLKVSEQLDIAIEERLAFALPSEEIIWRFMAVAFFDEKESPYKYDAKYGEEKIKRWKEKYSIEDFFLSVPLRDLIPLPDFSAIDLKDLLMVMSQMDKNYLSLLTGRRLYGQPSEDSLVE